MGKRPAFLFYPGDWLKDPCLRMCSATTRGIWIDLLCSMHELGAGEVSGSLLQLSRLCRCTSDELRTAIDELCATNAADVTECHEKITVTCRRLERESRDRKSGRERQKRRRAKTSGETHAPVTQKSRLHSSVTVSVTKENPLNPPGGDGDVGDVFGDLFSEMNSPDPFPEEQEPGRLSSEAVQQTADEFLIRWNRNGVLIPVDPIEFFNDRRLWGEFQGWARVPSRWKKLTEAMDKIESGKLTLGDHWRQLRKLICDPETVDKILAGSFEAKRKIGDKINPALQKGLTTRDRNFNLKLKAKPETAEMAK